MPVDCVTGMWPSNLREHEIKGLSRRWRHRRPGRRRLHDPRLQPAWRKYFDPRSGAHHGRKPGRRRRPRGRVFHARRTHVDNYECTWDLYKSIPSLNNEGKTVFDETVEFNERHKSNAMARLVDSGRAKVPVTSMGFSMEDRIELLKLSHAGEDALTASCVTDWLSPGFFETEFWYMWSTTFAFQPWHSAVDFRRYLHRFLLEFSRIDLDHKTEDGKFIVTGIHCLRRDKSEVIAVNDGDFVFLQNGSMTDASSLRSMTSAPRKLTTADKGGWALWEKLAGAQPEFGNPAAFNSCIAQSLLGVVYRYAEEPRIFRSDDSIQRKSAGHRRTGDVQGLELAVVHCAGPSPALPEPACRRAGCSGDTRYFRTGSAISFRSRWPSAMARKFCGNSAVTCDSIRRPLHRPTAFLAECLTSPACSCPACATIDRCRCLAARGISHSSASSSKFRMMSSLRWSTRCERPRWPSTSCSISTAKSRP